VSEPRFLTAELVLKIHRRSLARHGGLDGMRDQAGFESALGQPRNVYSYGQGDLFDVAAAYMFHISQAQAFLDGNKRTAVAAGLAFLKANKVAVKTDDLTLYRMVMEIAERRCDKVQLAALLRTSALPDSR
jgi:death-on-curing protein